MHPFFLVRFNTADSDVEQEVKLWNDNKWQPPFIVMKAASIKIAALFDGVSPSVPRIMTHSDKKVMISWFSIVY
jgi:hypothetical protein